MNVFFLLGIQLTAFFATTLALVWFMTRPTPAARRLAGVTQMFGVGGAAEESTSGRLRTKGLQIFRQLRLRLGLTETDKLRARFLAAGLREQKSIDSYFALRFLGTLAGVVVCSFIPQVSFFWMMVVVGLLYLAPDVGLSILIKKRRKIIELGLPDALDLMVVCIEAGLGLDQALMRAGQELQASNPVIASEFLQINLEQRAGKPRIEAWQSLAERTQLDVVKGFANMLSQTDRFGTPISQSMGAFADGLRKKRSQQAEEKAAKTTIKLMFPLVLFIFPSMFIVLLGPAVITISRSLDAFGK